MNTFLKPLLIFSFLISTASKPFTIDSETFKSPAAIAIYGVIIGHVGSRFADKLFDPSFYNARKIINLLTPQEKQMEALYEEKMLEIAQSKFNLNANQKQAVEIGYPRYKKNLLRKKKEIIDSAKSEEEKQLQIQELDKKLALIKMTKNNTSDSLFEQMLQQAGIVT